TADSLRRGAASLQPAPRSGSRSPHKPRVGKTAGLMDSTAVPMHSAAPWQMHSRTCRRSPASDDTDCRSRRSLGATGHMAPCSTSCWQPSCPGGDGMYASRIQSHTFDDLAAFSLRGETLVSPPSEKLTSAQSLQDLVIPLVALLVALVHHRRSYSVTLGSRRGPFRWPRQMRGSLGWRVTERD